MKRIISAMLAVIMCVLTLCGCEKVQGDGVGTGTESGASESGVSDGNDISSRAESGESVKLIAESAMEKWKNICASLFSDVNELTKEQIIGTYTTYYIQTTGKLEAEQRFSKRDIADFTKSYFNIDLYDEKTALGLGFSEGEDDFEADIHAQAIFDGEYRLLDCAEENGIFSMTVETVIDMEGVLPPGEDKVTRISEVTFTAESGNIYFISASYVQG